MDQPRHKPVKRGDIVPSIADHNLDLSGSRGGRSDGQDDASGSVQGLPFDLSRAASGAMREEQLDDAARSPSGGPARGDDADEGRMRERRPRDSRFPAGLLLAPALFALLIAASANVIAMQKQLGLVGGMLIAIGAAGVAAACFGVIAARSEPAASRIIGPAGLLLATMAAGSSIAQMI